MASALTREEVREAILDAADHLLARYGYRKTALNVHRTEPAARTRTGRAASAPHTSEDD